VEGQIALHKENSGFAAPTLGRHISWLSDFIFYPKLLYKSLHQSFCIHSWPSYTQKMVLHSSTARLSHRPYHFAMSVYFSAIKRDLAILTEWWQQRIAWCELLNAAHQIICIRKQHTNHMEDDIKRILQDKQFHLQLKSEQKEIIQNVLERKDSMAVLPTPRASERACVTFPPLILYKVRSYMQIISHDTLR
jgi:hypothetical protein